MMSLQSNKNPKTIFDHHFLFVSLFNHQILVWVSNIHCLKKQNTACLRSPVPVKSRLIKNLPSDFCICWSSLYRQGWPRTHCHQSSSLVSQVLGLQVQMFSTTQHLRAWLLNSGQSHKQPFQCLLLELGPRERKNMKIIQNRKKLQSARHSGTCL